jgi:hypothetical protein
VNTAARPDVAPGLEDSDVALFEAMLRLRRFEEKAGMLYALGTLAAPCPLGVGQEGALAGLAAALDSSDALVALSDRPTTELALGGSVPGAFQRLLSEPPSDAEPFALLKVPGEEIRRLPPKEAFAAADRFGQIVLLLDEPAGLSASLAEVTARVFPVLLTRKDRRPPGYSVPPDWAVRECDGSDAVGVRDAMMAARKDRFVALSILTPPFLGHARDGRRQAPERREAEDPIARLRLRLVTERRIPEADIAALEARIRDDIAAGARAISLSCTP